MTQQQIFELDRRTFTKLAGGAAGGLMLGVTFGCSDQGQKLQGPPVTINAYIRISPDETITLINPAEEMGQGVRTAMPQILADELDARWDQIFVEQAPLDLAYANPGMARPAQRTSGSMSVRYYFTPLRQVAAAARDMLVRAAAEQWGVVAAECETKDGFVIRASDGAKLSYGTLADAASKLEPSDNPPLKSPDQFTLIGQSLKSVDQLKKVDGSLEFTIDIDLPGMLHAALAITPVFGGQLASYDESEALKVKGVRQIVPMKDAIAVVAERYWQAKKALDLVQVTFEGGDSLGLSTEAIYADLREGAEQEEGITFRDDGNSKELLQASQQVIEGTYVVPYLAHASMEPLSCVAKLEGETCEVWTGTQSIQAAARSVARFLDMPTEQITIHTGPMGGSFGRRLGADLEIRAVEIAQAAGAPVKVIWSREEDIRHDYYRPAVAAHFAATLDEQGFPEALDLRIATYAMGPPRGGRADSRVVGSMSDMVYHIPHVRFGYVQREQPIPVGSWRSVARSHNTFFSESLIDELAHKAGHDPLDYRRALIKETPRLLAVLELVAEKSEWGTALPEGHGRGIAATPCFDSFVAHVVEVSVFKGELTVHKVINAVDCGIAVNPDIVVQQIEGAMIQGLYAALHNEITIENGAVVESNFHDYQMLMPWEMPEVETHIVQSGELPGGIGEVGTPALAPALTNAIYAATGLRIRTLPISGHELS